MYRSITCVRVSRGQCPCTGETRHRNLPAILGQLEHSTRGSGLSWLGGHFGCHNFEKLKKKTHKKRLTATQCVVWYLVIGNLILDGTDRPPLFFFFRFLNYGREARS